MRWQLWLIVGWFGLVGCHRTLRDSVTQPNPLKQPLETLRHSEKLEIVTGDMDLVRPRYRGASGNAILVNDRVPLHNTASFTVVSRDRLRFHIQIEHKWQNYAELDGWQAVLIDDRGVRYQPDSVEPRKPQLVVEMWDVETRTAVRNRFGDIVQVLNDGHKRPQALGSVALFRGKGDLVFYHHDIFRSDVRWLKLRLTRAGMTFEFLWRFEEPAEHRLATSR